MGLAYRPHRKDTKPFCPYALRESSRPTLYKAGARKSSRAEACASELLTGFRTLVYSETASSAVVRVCLLTGVSTLVCAIEAV